MIDLTSNLPQAQGGAGGSSTVVTKAVTVVAKRQRASSGSDTAVGVPPGGRRGWLGRNELPLTLGGGGHSPLSGMPAQDPQNGPAQAQPHAEPQASCGARCSEELQQAPRLKGMSQAAPGKTAGRAKYTTGPGSVAQPPIAVQVGWGPDAS
jgi:hypothetical protein